MDAVSVERVIAAPPEKIFDLLVHPERHKEIDGSGTVQGVRGESQRLQLGSKFGMSMKLGIPYGMTSTVIEYEENRRIAWQPRPAYPIIGPLLGGRIWRYELEPVAEGTRVRESWDISHERGKFMVRGAAEQTRKNMAKTLERIEEIVTAS
ncbi:MAG: SRPBCC family protein [Actinomycetes bacterium]